MVKVFANFKDNLIIDRHNPIFYGTLFRGEAGKETLKMKHLRSENSEDALTWNVFSTLKNLAPNFWVRKLLESRFGNKKEFEELTFDGAGVIFWGKVVPPRSRLQYMASHPGLCTTDNKRLREIERRSRKGKPLEGNTEVDVQIVTKDILVCIEAKYLSPLSLHTTWDDNRDQIIRNVDVGTAKAWCMGLDFYFVLLTPRKDISGRREPKHWDKVKDYMNNDGSRIREMLPYRRDLVCSKVAQNIGWLRWEDIAQFLASADGLQFSSLENFMIQQLLEYLKAKGLSF